MTLDTSQGVQMRNANMVKCSSDKEGQSKNILKVMSCFKENFFEIQLADISLVRNDTWVMRMENRQLKCDSLFYSSRLEIINDNTFKSSDHSTWQNDTCRLDEE